MLQVKDLQKQVDEWVNQYAEGYWKPHEILARLMEEVGELAREVNHRFGPKKKKSTENKKQIGEEISDIIFTLTCLANSLDINLDDSFNKVLKKLKTRDKKRWKKK